MYVFSHRICQSALLAPVVPARPKEFAKFTLTPRKYLGIKILGGIYFLHLHSVAIWNLRFRNAAVCDFIPRFLGDFSAELAVRVAICNLRFENAAICCDFFGTLSLHCNLKNSHGRGWAIGGRGSKFDPQSCSFRRQHAGSVGENLAGASHQD